MDFINKDYNQFISSRLISSLGVYSGWNTLPLRPNEKIWNINLDVVP